jgi:hypothetical protein
MSLDRKQESKNVNNNIMSDKTGGIFGQWKERRKGEKRPTEKKHFWKNGKVVLYLHGTSKKNLHVFR